MTVSVVIPAKNEERYLPLLLEGLAKQTLKPVQIILADAKSTDSTRALAEASGLIVVEGGMPGPGRNAGAKIATGDMLLFLDADVQIRDPKFIESAVKEMTERGLDIASPDMVLVNGSRADRLGHYIYCKYVRAWGAVRPHAPGFCIFVTRALFEQVGGFDPTIVLCEDHEFAARAGKRGKFGFLNSMTIGVTDRRFRRDGSLNVGIKYVLAELHTIFIGPIRHNWFHYDFGYDDLLAEQKQPKG
jgi:glycosyltransferase involved in cell wall biosynthesis